MNATQYNRINLLLSEFSLLSAALEAAEAEIKQVQLAAASDLLPKHAAAKVALSSLEKQLRQISDEHYADLFPDEKRTHKTPFGSLEYRKSSSLKVDDEEKSILLIKLQAGYEAANNPQKPRFTLDTLLRKKEELNLEALGELDDATLSLFAITREKKDNFKINPFALKSDKPANSKKTAPKAVPA